MSDDNLLDNERLIAINSKQNTTLKLPENWYLTTNTILDRTLANTTVTGSIIKAKTDDVSVDDELNNSVSRETSC